MTIRENEPSGGHKVIWKARSNTMRIIGFLRIFPQSLGAGALAVVLAGVGLLHMADTSQAAQWQRRTTGNAAQCEAMCLRAQGRCSRWHFSGYRNRICSLRINRNARRRPVRLSHAYCRRVYGQYATLRNGRCVAGSYKYGNEPTRVCRRKYGPNSYYSFHTSRCERSNSRGTVGAARRVYPPRSAAECRSRYGRRGVWRNGQCSFYNPGYRAPRTTGRRVTPPRRVNPPYRGRAPSSGNTCIYGMC